MLLCQSAYLLSRMKWLVRSRSQFSSNFRTYRFSEDTKSARYKFLSVLILKGIVQHKKFCKHTKMKARKSRKLKFLVGCRQQNLFMLYDPLYLCSLAVFCDHTAFRFPFHSSHFKGRCAQQLKTVSKYEIPVLLEATPRTCRQLGTPQEGLPRMHRDPKAKQISPRNSFSRRDATQQSFRLERLVNQVDIFRQ